MKRGELLKVTPVPSHFLYPLNWWLYGRGSSSPKSNSLGHNSLHPHKNRWINSQHWWLWLCHQLWLVQSFQQDEISRSQWNQNLLLTYGLIISFNLKGMTHTFVLRSQILKIAEMTHTFVPRSNWMCISEKVVGLCQGIEWLSNP